MNRRSFLKQGGLAAGAALPLMSTAVRAADAPTRGSGVQSARGPRRTPPNTQAGLEPFAGALTMDLALHLLRRTGFGPRFSEAKAIVNGNPAQIVDAMLADQPQPTPPSWASLQPDLTSAGQTVNATNMTDFRNWWMHIMYTSSNPLAEKMVLFWTNHFVSETAKVKVPQYIYWQNYLHRQYALGNFKDYTKAITIDNAMVWYLDSYLSTKAKPNENYARELMELFTIGPFDTTNLTDPTGKTAPVPNYTETELQQAARAITGWVMHTTSGMSTYTTADFRANLFDSGADKVFMGKTGNWSYTDIIDTIFEQLDSKTQKNKVALFICTKLYGYFVYDDPGDPTDTSVDYTRYCNPLNPIIQGLADTFVSSGFSIRAVLRKLLLSSHFFDANTIGAQLKSPVDFILSATRQLELLTIKDSSLVQQSSALAGAGLSQLGQPPNVKGFPGYRSWISTSSLPSRNSITDSITKGTPPPFDMIALAKLYCDNDAAKYNDATALVKAFADFLSPIPLSATQLTALRDTLLNGAGVNDWSTTYPGANIDIQRMLSLILRFAEFQLA